MRRFSKFLMQACVCLFVTTLTFAQMAHTSGETMLSASASENIARPTVMPVSQINEQLAAAKRTLQTQNFNTSAVQLAAFNSTTGQMNVLSIDKDSFLTKGGDYQLVSNLGQLSLAAFKFFAVPTKVKGMGTFPVRAFAAVG